MPHEEILKVASYYECSKCLKKFKYESEMARHEKSHSRQYTCNICSKKFSFQSALRRHEKQHQRKGSVQCSDCGGTFRDESLLKRHIKYAHNGERYGCGKCNAYFTSEIALQTHSKIHQTNSERRYQCSHLDCNKTFNFLHHLKHHELTHTNAKQHYCNVCGKGFIQAHHFKTHLKIHEPDGWLSCSMVNCNKKFPNKYALKRHILTHTNRLIDNGKCDSYTNIKVSTLEYLDKSLLTDHVLCDSCGQLIHRKQISRHATKCITKQSKDNTHETVVEVSHLKDDLNKQFSMLTVMSTKAELINNPIKNCDVENIVAGREDKGEKCLEEQLYVPNIEFDNNCKAVLGGCIVSGNETIDDNCLCAKISNSEERKFEEEIILKSNQNTITTARNGILEDNVCECKETTNAICKTETDKINNNVVKVKNVFSHSMKELTINNNNTILNKECTDIVADTNDSKFILENPSIAYNSCKAVLGNCIVSGDTTIGEGCLCALMSNNIDDSAQEIEDITPCSQMLWLN